MVDDLDDRGLEARIRAVLTQALEDRAAPADRRDLRVELDWHGADESDDARELPSDHVRFTFATTTFWISRADAADDAFLRGLVVELLDGSTE